MVNRVSDDEVGTVGRVPVKVNSQPEWRAGRNLERPAHDELFGVAVNILFVKRRRVQRVKELLNVVQSKFNEAHRSVRHAQFPGLYSRSVCALSWFG